MKAGLIPLERREKTFKHIRGPHELQTLVEKKDADRAVSIDVVGDPSDTDDMISETRTNRPLDRLFHS